MKLKNHLKAQKSIMLPGQYEEYILTLKEWYYANENGFKAWVDSLD